ncbi:hypothetical protein AVDCRST_MAG94-2951 [uncultured Leptolyngbya sp.]|uniref:Uncharacterized protein n=1 Tax=uncultured Leptolyngbya sp. TaxID=332963 RepID=A0A6J4MF76_9CYAN|nr:hypothetical protein AVDCRST_MAG94-2951 [uncultured Leptolyngbya sp.]
MSVGVALLKLAPVIQTSLVVKAVGAGSELFSCRETLWRC